MNSAHKLKAIKGLRLTDGLSWSDAHDIAMWVLLAGAHCNTSVLSDKTIERIECIFHQHFEE